tara:strand:- start:4081 stop:4665 length:585 start_codon:yes stop_codon:yes gene_type:complete
MIAKIFSILFFLFFLFGCSNSKEFSISEIDFSEYKGIIFDANNVLVEDVSNKDIEPPYIDHLIFNNVKLNMSKWIKARIIPNFNNENFIKIIIEKANVKAFPIDNNNKIEDIFLNKAAIKIEVDIFIIIEIIDTNSEKLAYLDLKAFKSKDLPENISLNEKDYYIQEMINDIMRDFDKLAVNKIKEIFYQYIKI